MRVRLPALFFALALAALPAAALSQPSPAAVQRLVLPAEVTPEHYDLEITPDAKALTFKGRVAIDLKVTKATERVMLNAVELNLDKAVLDGALSPVRQEPDGARQAVALIFAKPIKPGRHRLVVDYRGVINTSSSGFFAVDYDTDQGKQRLIATKFEPAAARRFLPSFDEPGRKATFTVTATVPAAQMALSNMPVAEETPLPGGLKRVRFQKTPKMASYLLFFGAGDFERRSQMVDGVDVGVVVRKGAAAKAQFALDSAVKLVALYNDYFGTPYPLPKLDLIASPGAGSFSAMENWGAIFYFEPAMLVDPAVSTDADRQRVHSVVAHEIAHMWFGDLVTMEWWDDLWLNEGFASWMAAKATDRLHPDWKPWLGSMAGRETALGLDVLPTTHPVVTHLADVTQANQAFDSITYQKGQAVIRMVEAYVGEDAFREGVRRYMKKHAYGSTVTSDLWTEIEAAAGQPVRDIARDFLEQPGVPLIEVGRSADGKLLLGQSRFSWDDKAETVRWRAPLTVRSLADGKVVKLLAVNEATADVTLPVVANLGQTAYLRVAYDPESFAALAAGFAALDPIDQMGLLSDSWALGEAGIVDAPNALELIGRIPPDAEPLVWVQALAVLGEVDGLYGDRPGRAAFRAFARTRLKPLYDLVGFDAKAGESDNTGVLRERLLMALSQFDDPVVIAEARRRFADLQSVPAGVRLPIVRIVARHAGPADFQAIRKLAAETRDPLAKRQLNQALAFVRDPGLAARALELTVTEEVPGSTRPLMIRQVAAENPDLAWAFAQRTLDVISANLDLRQRYQYLPQIASGSASPARADELAAYAKANFPEGARKFAFTAEAEIRKRARAREDVLPAIDRWLAAGAPRR
jgi:aminopeptidase N